MKRFIVALLTAAMTMAAVTGCGKGGDTSQGMLFRIRYGNGKCGNRKRGSGIRGCAGYHVKGMVSSEPGGYR